MHENSLARRAAAEVVGTALLVFVGAGSVAALILLGDGKPFSGADLGFVALAFGFVVVACVYVLGPISGSHINPAVTIAFAATRRFPWRDVPVYVAAQFVRRNRRRAADVGRVRLARDVVSASGSGWRRSTSRR